jgi:quercetin dioxygenase-like cupin family protein
MKAQFLGIGVISAALASGGVVSGQAAEKDVKTTPVMTNDNVTWQDADVLPPGAKFAVLAAAGDWNVVRVKFPPHYLVPPHAHPNAETVTIVSGKVGFGFGKTPDMSGALLEPGAFFALEAGGWHYVWTGDEGGIIDVQVSDPGGMQYANPSDDPKMKRN